MQAKDILKQARYILSDTGKDRWTDDRLLALLYEGIVNIAANTTIFVEYFYVPIADNIIDYDFSAIATKILRVEYLDRPIPFATYEEMDRKEKLWQHDKGPTPELFIIDKQKRACMKMYPIIENATNPYIHYSGPFGIVTGISYSDIMPIFSYVYGDMGDYEDTGFLKVFHIRKHAELTDVNDELFIDDICKQPLEHYVAGRALRDNQDTQNRAMGGEELQLYQQLINDFSIQKAVNFTDARRTTQYRPLG